MKRNDPTFKEMVSRIASGELTRKQAAEAYDLNLGTLHVWVQRSKLALPKAPTGAKALAGAALEWKNTDPVRIKALEDACNEALSGSLTVDQAVAKYKEQGVARATLQRMVRARLDESGVQRKRGPKSEPESKNTL